MDRRLRRTALANVACVAKPHTSLALYRRLMRRISPDVEAFIARFARQNIGWGASRIRTGDNIVDSPHRLHAWLVPLKVTTG
jgi:hypothetical protein